MTLLKKALLGTGARLPIVKIENATFYRRFPNHQEKNEDAHNLKIFPNLTFSIPPEPIPNQKNEPQNWAIIGPSSSGKTTFLQVLRGQHLCFPPTARSFPHLSSSDVPHHLRSPANAIRHAGFDGGRSPLGGSSTRGSYLSARYESRREETDYSLLDYLRGNTSLNPLDDESNKSNEIMREGSLEKVVADLGLQPLVDMPIGNLSNGQMRRAMIAKAIVSKPELLLLDEPFMGLDISTLQALLPLLENLAASCSPRVLLTLRPQDPIPEWITHIVHLGPELRVAEQGPKEEVLRQIYPENRKHKRPSRFSHLNGEEEPPKGEALVEMEGVEVKYGQKTVLGNWRQIIENKPKSGLYWTVRRGERWGIFGPNGSGKTTILSLICSDHPQTYSLPIKIFGQSRLPQLGKPGVSIFDIQARIGHSSPEIHAFFPRQLSVRQTLENAWADTFLGRPKLSFNEDIVVDRCLNWFRPELDPFSPPTLLVELNKFLKPSRSLTNDKTAAKEYLSMSTDWADMIQFGDVPFSSQRLALFLRAIIKQPDLVVLDEAFSGMDITTRNKCMLFLKDGMKMWKPQNKLAEKADATKCVSGKIHKTTLELSGEALFQGLSARQALICVSHVKEEVPAVVAKWMCLPAAGGQSPARFGRMPKRYRNIYGDEQMEEEDWYGIWGLETPGKHRPKLGRPFQIKNIE